MYLCLEFKFAFIYMLNEVYPSPAPIRRNLWISLLFGLFISFFLVFFEPFDIDIAGGRNTIASLLFYGCITALALALYMYFLPLMLPNLFSDSRWTVKHQLVYCFLILFTISTLNGLYANYIHALDFNWSNYWWIINRTFILGVIPFSFLILVDFKRKDRLNNKVAEDIRAGNVAARSTIASRSHMIKTDLKNETFTFNDAAFSHAIADGNYTDIYLLEDDKSKSQTLRISLSSLENQLETQHIMRCHRSYIVNLKRVSNVRGNAQGLTLSLQNSNHTVPVSRKYIPLVKAFFSQQ